MESSKSRDEVARRVAERLGLKPDKVFYSKRERLILDALISSERRVEEAEAKLREQGIIWEEGKGYVYDGKG